MYPHRIPKHLPMTAQAPSVSRLLGWTRRSACKEKLQHVAVAVAYQLTDLSSAMRRATLECLEWHTTCALDLRKRVKPTTRGSALLAARLAKHNIGLRFTVSGQKGSVPGPTTAGAATISTSVPGARPLMFWCSGSDQLACLQR